METHTHVFRVRKREKRRKGVQAACNTCRLRKLKCDGQRPCCNRCLKRGDLDCTYDTEVAEETRMQAMKREMSVMKTKLDSISETWTVLKDLPSDRISQLILDVLSQPDPTTSLIDMGRKIQIQSSNLSRQLSTLETMKASFPNTKSSVQFELYLYFPKWYPPLIADDAQLLTPTEKGLVDLQDWQTARSWHLASSVQLAPAAFNYFRYVHDDELQDVFHVSSWNLWVQRSCLNFWTNVPISAKLAEKAFNTYLHVDHVLFGFMDTELFLSDFVNCKTRFCSSALVNAVLYYACMKIAQCDSEAEAMVTKFQIEAENALENDDPTVAKIAAFNVYYTTNVFDGPFENAKPFLDKAIMLCDMLYGWESPSPQFEAFCATAEDERGLSHILWSVCGSAVYMAHRWENKAPPPIPRLPIPFLETSTRAVITLPGSPAVDVDKIACERYICAAITANLPLVRESVMLQLIQNSLSDEDRASLVASIYRRALENATSMGRPSSLHAELTDIAAISQMWSHLWILSIFQPLTHYRKPIPGFQASGGTAGAIFVASARQLQHMVFLYQRHHSLTPPTLAYHGPVFVAAVALTQIRRITHPGLKFEALMWVFADLALSFPGIRGLMQSLAVTGYDTRFVDFAKIRLLYDRFSNVRKSDRRGSFRNPSLSWTTNDDENSQVAAVLRARSYDVHFATRYVIDEHIEEDSATI